MRNLMQPTLAAPAPVTASLASRLRDKLERRPEFFTLFLLIALAA